MLGTHFSGQSRLEDLKRTRIWRAKGLAAGTGLEMRIPDHPERSFRSNVNTDSDRW